MGSVYQTRLRCSRSGAVAEWLRSGLQSRVHRFDSGRRLFVHPFLADPPPLVIAHRGAAEDAPENTIEAFAGAVGLGCRYLETDAHATKDGVVVAFHDHRLDRVTDRAGAIADLTADEVERADAGYHFRAPDGTFPYRGQGVRVPRLETILTRWPDARVNIDPKDDLCVDPLVALIDRLDAWERVCIGAFSDARLHRVRTKSRGRACTSMGPRAVATVTLAAAATGRMPRLGADCLQVPPRQGRIPLVTPRFVKAAHRAGLPVHVWTIDDALAMRRLLAMGVDGIMTNRPRVLRDLLQAATR
jgi:glycerophosphoryl diester phosphodiesterase